MALEIVGVLNLLRVVSSDEFKIDSASDMLVALLDLANVTETGLACIDSVSQAVLIAFFEFARREYEDFIEYHPASSSVASSDRRNFQCSGRSMIHFQ